MKIEIKGQDQNISAIFSSLDKVDPFVCMAFVWIVSENYFPWNFFWLY